jgi:type VI secretion system protein ImpF
VAEGPPKDRILPALLDRLTDDGPGEGDGRRDRGMSLRDYRRAVLRDLTWLLNANSPPPFENIHEYPLVARSVLNFGMSELAGLTASTLSPDVLEKLVRDAIRNFEPRVNPSSLTVRAIDAADETSGNVIHLEIKGEIFAEPIPEALYVKTEIDLESGHCRLKEEG